MDDDTIAYVAAALTAAEQLGIDFLPGMEISCEYPHPCTMHLLGYGVDVNSTVLTELTKTLVAVGDIRYIEIIARLRELNVAITMEEVENEAGGNVVGRPHIAAILLRKGYVKTTKDAFNKYLAPGGSAYFDKERLTAKQAVGMVLESGGIPVLAHPVQLPELATTPNWIRVVKDLVDLGLACIEVIDSDH